MATLGIRGKDANAAAIPLAHGGAANRAAEGSPPSDGIDRCLNRENVKSHWLNSYKEVNLISTVSQWISVCLLEIRLISNGDMDGLLYGAYYGHASL